MEKLFRCVKLESNWWGVFIVNPNDETDRYLVSSTFDKIQDAQHFADENNRITAAYIAATRN